MLTALGGSTVNRRTLMHATRLLCLVIIVIAPRAVPAVEERSDGISLDRQLAALKQNAASTARRAVTTCMRLRGFEYTSERMTEDADLALSDREWLVRFGYGITTRTQRAEDQHANDNSGQPRDVAGLTDERRKAYEEALGPGAGADEATERRRSCSEVGSSLMAGIEGVITRYDDDRGDFYDRVSRDPRIESARHAWASCMSTKGFAYEAPPQIAEDLERRRLSQMDDPIQLAALQATEMAIAGADDVCRTEFVDGAMHVVTAEYRQQYVTGTRALLLNARAAVRTARERWRAVRTDQEGAESHDH